MSKSVQRGRKINFSVIDFVIIVIALTLLIGIAARYDIVNRLFSKTSLTDAKVTFVASAISDAEANAFKENTAFYANGELFGTLTSVSEPVYALIYSENEHGVLTSHEDKNLFDIEGSFSCKVMKSENGYLLGGNRYIAAGSEFTVRANGVAVTITIISVQELD